MTPPRLSARDLGWAVGGRFVLHDVALDAAAGSITIVTGDNGAGKSTLLELLAGLRQPDRGQVALDGVPMPEVEPAVLARRVARLGHKPGVYLDLSARENVALLAALAGVAADARAIDDALHTVGLDRRDRDRPVRGFSRGMLQRTALARLLLVGCDVWLLDEPSTGLDVAGTERLIAVVKSARSRGTCVVVATHDPVLLPLADRRVWLVHGHLVDVAPPPVAPTAGSALGAP